MNHANRIASAVIIIFGLFVVYMATNYTIFANGYPGAGFFPLCTGLLLSVAGLVVFISSFIKEESVEKFLKSGDFKNIGVILGCSVGAIIITPLTGFSIALGLMAGAIAKLLGTSSWIKVIALVVFIPIMAYLLFGMFLGVLLPKGLLNF